ncbi:hypothetical protein KC320_g12 [Hortaea werneckii]|nr:hypothetical protein KC320_g12 [Hortaea werneckii]
MTGSDRLPEDGSAEVIYLDCVTSDCARLAAQGAARGKRASRWPPGARPIGHPSIECRIPPYWLVRISVGNGRATLAAVNGGLRTRRRDSALSSSSEICVPLRLALGDDRRERALRYSAAYGCKRRGVG